VLRDVTPCSFVVIIFGGVNFFNIENIKRPLFFPEDEGSKFLRNTATNVTAYSCFTLLNTTTLSNTAYKNLKFQNEQSDSYHQNSDEFGGDRWKV
jgi:hypothetical protein